jgi:CelD/BcsL family acetyltransferase involved in cellulose biosynthesis
VQRFHQALIGRGVASGVVDLLRISAGRRLIGVLLNLRAGDCVASYQSGFDYAGASPSEKPGLTCHHAAIEHARNLGAVAYDFLAGDSRYKRSFSQADRALHWLTWRPQPSMVHVGLHRAISFVRGVLGR